MNEFCRASSSSGVASTSQSPDVRSPRSGRSSTACSPFPVIQEPRSPHSSRSSPAPDSEAKRFHRGPTPQKSSTTLAGIQESPGVQVPTSTFPAPSPVSQAQQEQQGQSGPMAQSPPPSYARMAASSNSGSGPPPVSSPAWRNQVPRDLNRSNPLQQGFPQAGIVTPPRHIPPPVGQRPGPQQVRNRAPAPRFPGSDHAPNPGHGRKGKQK